MRDKVNEQDSRRAAHRVFPSAHSTQPSSGPNVSIGVRSSSGKRPSSLKDCFSEVKINSFSGIEGDGGLIVIRCDGQVQAWFKPVYLAVASIFHNLQVDLLLL